jgi:hypothetical protein
MSCYGLRVRITAYRIKNIAGFCFLMLNDPGLASTCTADTPPGRRGHVAAGGAGHVATINRYSYSPFSESNDIDFLWS